MCGPPIWSDRSALALILFDGGLKARFQSIRAVLAPSMMLATLGVLLTALVTAPVAKYRARPQLDRGAAGRRRRRLHRCGRSVFAGACAGLRLRPRVGATLEVESGTNDPFAVFLTLMLVEYLIGRRKLGLACRAEFGREAMLGAIVGVIGGRLVVPALNRVALRPGAACTVRLRPRRS